MSDYADLAAAREQELRDDALARRARENEKRTAAASAECCAVCEEPIPEARRHALPGVHTCVECQTDLEWALQRKERDA